MNRSNQYHFKFKQLSKLVRDRITYHYHRSIYSNLNIHITPDIGSEREGMDFFTWNYLNDFEGETCVHV